MNSHIQFLEIARLALDSFLAVDLNTLSLSLKDLGEMENLARKISVLAEYADKDCWTEIDKREQTALDNEFDRNSLPDLT